MSTEQNTQLVQAVFAAFGRGDVQAVLDAMADDVVHDEPSAGPAPFRGTYRGRGEVAAFFRQMAESVEVLSFEPKQFVAQGDMVIAFGNYQFRARATGKAYESDWAMAWQCKSGKIAAWKTYKDSAAELAALQSG